MIKLSVRCCALFLGFVPAFWAPQASGQVTVGYSTLTSVTGAAIREQVYRQRTTDLYEMTGVNVEPVDGGNTFNRNTIWKIYEEANPWSLSIVDENPRVDVNDKKTNSQLVQAARRESVYAVLSGPLSGTVRRNTISPFAQVILPAIIPVSTSVFPDNLGSGQTSKR